MKLIIVFLTVLVMAIASADHTMFHGMSKEQLAEYTITITDKDGKVVGKMSRAEYKVVKIGTEGFTKEETTQLITTHVEAEKAKNKNRVRFMGGVGPTGRIEKENDQTSTTVKTQQGTVVGVGLDREVADRISVGTQYLSNGTVTLGLGLDF